MSLGVQGGGGLGVAISGGSALYRANPTFTDFTALAALYAGATRTVQVADGAALTADVPLNLPSGATWLGPPGGTVTSTIANSPPLPTNCAFHLDAPAAINSGTLTSDVTPSAASNVVHVSETNAPAAGGYLEVSHGVSAWVGKIASPTGSGSPWTGTVALTTEDGAAYPIPLAISSSVAALAEYASRPTGVTIDGRGCLLTGTVASDQKIEILRAYRCEARDMRFNCPAGESGVGFDVGCSECVGEELHVRVRGTTAEVGLYNQSSDHHAWRRCTSDGGPIGLEVLDGFDTRVEDCRFSKQTGYGLVVGSLPFSSGHASLGSFNTVVDGGASVGSATGAFIFGATNTRFTGYSCDDCTTGYLVGTSADCIVADGTLFDGCVASNCGTGWLINASVTGSVLTGCRALGSTVTAVSGVGDVRIHDFVGTFTSAASYGMVFTNALADLSKITLTMLAGQWAIQASGTLLILDDALLTTTNQIGVYVTAGTVRLYKVTTIGSASSTGLYVSASCTAYLGPGCDLSGSAKGIVAADATATITMSGYDGASSVAMGDADKVLTWAQYAVSVIKTTGTLTADRKIILPPVQGKVWTINNATAGGKNVAAYVSLNQTSTTGTSIDCGAGITRVYFDGTNVVQA